MTALKKVKSGLKPAVYVAVDSILESVKSYKGLYSKKYQDHIH